MAEYIWKKVLGDFSWTTHNGEGMAIILRFVTDDWVMQQCLVQLQLLGKCLTGEEIVSDLISVLQVGYGISPGTLVGSMHDRVSTNTVDMTTLRVLYPDFLDVGCFSHTINHVGNHVGKRFCAPTLSKCGKGVFN